MRAPETAQVRVETHGKVPDWAVGLAAARVGSLLRAAAEPVLSARVTLTEAADPAVARPSLAEATIDMNGRVIRAQAAELTMRLAIGQMASRLRVRLGRAARNWAALRGTIPAGEPGEWRHQEMPAHRPPYFPRPRQERAVICRASYAAGPETPAEAAVELDLLDYQFHLFTERETGQDCLLSRAGDGYHLAMTRPEPARLTTPLSGTLTVSAVPAPALTAGEAAGRLEATGEAHLFFTDTATGRGAVIYHRYDGHYGLVTTGQAAAEPAA